ncbi:hypothetical protein [Vagococcus lutrae]|uniref:hypothetical protein n=1 Tax=Vagococcus lutrae TaxID=81947 RepID=UPI00288EBBCB|nr:hypothetical protein [Vagococcus lutrae]MDT2808185.1 hypothetical protein [Vagococcus lutrae]
MKKLYGNKVFIGISILIIFIGVVGFLLPYGNERWNFIFENLIWFPIELAITVFVLEKILENSHEKQKIERFIKLSSVETKETIDAIKAKLYSAYTATMLNDKSELDNEMLKIYINFNEIYTVDVFKKGLDIYIVDTKKPLFDVHIKENFNYIVCLLKFSFEVNKLIEEYLNKNVFFLPEDVFNEIVILRNVLQNSYLFKVDLTFQDKLNLYGQNLHFSDETIKTTLVEMEAIYTKMYESIIRLENILNDLPPAK